MEDYSIGKQGRAPGASAVEARMHPLFILATPRDVPVLKLRGVRSDWHWCGELRAKSDKERTILSAQTYGLGTHQSILEGVETKSGYPSPRASRVPFTALCWGVFWRMTCRKHPESKGKYPRAPVVNITLVSRVSIFQTSERKKNANFHFRPRFSCFFRGEGNTRVV